MATPHSHRRPAQRSTPRASTRTPLRGGFVALIAALAIVFSVLAEIRTIAVGYRDGFSYDHWSFLRVGVIACLFFVALWFLGRWLANGGLARTLAYLKADHWFHGRRLGFTLIGCVIVAIAGAGIGLLGAWLFGTLRDWRYVALGIIFALLIFVFVRSWRAISDEPARGFLGAGLAFGLAFLAVMPLPPFSTWDGEVHFNKANAMSYLENAEYDGGDQLSLDGGFRIVGSDGDRSWYDYSFDALVSTYDEYVTAQAEGDAIVVDGAVIANGSSWLQASSIGVAPVALGLWTGRLLGLNIVGEYTVARLFNLLSYLIIWFFGIRFLRGLKLLFSVIALVPVGVFMAANFGYDPLLISCVGFAFCRFIGEIQRRDRPLTFGRGAAILIPFFIGCLVKATYFPLALVFTAMPGRKFDAKHPARRFGWIAATVGVALALLASFTLPLLFTQSVNTVGDARGGDGISSGDQIKFILSQPLGFVQVLWATFLDFFSPYSLGFAFGRLIHLPPSPFEDPLKYFYVIFVVIIMLFDRSSIDRDYGTAALRITDIIGIIGAFILCATSMYVTFTAVGAPQVAGLQPRYMLPMLPAICAIAFNIPALGRIVPSVIERHKLEIFWSVEIAFFALYFLFRYIPLFN